MVLWKGELQMEMLDEHIQPAFAFSKEFLQLFHGGKSFFSRELYLVHLHSILNFFLANLSNLKNV
jgi:hypothetical protein